MSVGFYYIDNIKWSSSVGRSVDRYVRLDASNIKRIKISPKQQLEIKLAAKNLNKQEINEFNDADIHLSLNPIIIALLRSPLFSLEYLLLYWLTMLKKHIDS